MTAKMDAQTVVVEPNLSKRMEQRKENAIRRAKEKEMWEQMQVQLQLAARDINKNNPINRESLQRKLSVYVEPAEKEADLG